MGHGILFSLAGLSNHGLAPLLGRYAVPQIPSRRFREVEHPSTLLSHFSSPTFDLVAGTVHQVQVQQLGHLSCFATHPGSLRTRTGVSGTILVVPPKSGIDVGMAKSSSNALQATHVSKQLTN